LLGILDQAQGGEHILPQPPKVLGDSSQVLLEENHAFIAQPELFD
jgi:hypothetical protein